MNESDSHRYLGTGLTPAEYYRQHARRYANPHAEGIAEALTRLAARLRGNVLDWGCGDGLVTKLLSDRGLTFVGVDNAPQMVKRYIKETGFPAHVAGFADPLPPADSAVASYSLHLATPAEAAVMWWRLAEAGVAVLVVLTPFKDRPAAPAHYYHAVERIKGNWGPSGKTIYGMVYVRDP